MILGLKLGLRFDLVLGLTVSSLSMVSVAAVVLVIGAIIVSPMSVLIAKDRGEMGSDEEVGLAFALALALGSEFGLAVEEELERERVDERAGGREEEKEEER
jgi:hypothetical protein